MTFHVGQKVVCVDDSLPENPWHRQHPLVKRQVYVVRKLHTYPDCNCIDIDGSGRMWQHWRFRPLIEKKTDISIFTSLLDPSNHTPLPEHQPQRRKVSHDLCGNE